MATRVPVSGIAFDLDGTLLDTIRDLACAVNATFAARGERRVPEADVRRFVGKGMGILIRRALAASRGVTPDAIAPSDGDAVFTAYQEAYARQLGRETRIYAGVLDGLARLSAMGLPLAVVTNKASRFVRPHLVQAGIEQHFALVLGAEDLPTRKPAPGPLLHVADRFGIPIERLLMVGDSGNDVQAARAAGCPVFVVPYGYTEGAPVESLAADAIVPSLVAVADLIEPVPPIPCART